MRIASIQMNPQVGAVIGNADKIIHLGQQAEAQGAELIIFPELALIGYPPEDLVERPDVAMIMQQQLQRIAEAARSACWIVGHAVHEQGKVYNAASYLFDGEVQGTYHKRCLPNYDVFDEVRNFSVGNQPCVFDLNGKKIGLTICEDIWHQQPAQEAADLGAELLVVINASPFAHQKLARRQQEVAKRIEETQLPICYVNLVGGQDDLVFDGCSFFMDANQNLYKIGKAFEESSYLFDSANPDCGQYQWPTQDEEWLYQALVTGTRDYVHKNGFSGALLGLSGGIDSALTLCVAVDALGADKVHAVMMPYKYTAQMSVEDAKKQAENLAVKFDIVPIEPAVTGFEQMLAPLFEGTAKDTTEENLQARSRGVLLMALSNKFGKIVLTTGNKSEMATGYATLYGDMAGGYAVLKDVFKHWVYALSKYCNRNGEVIPERVITRPPSAELAPDQVDQDSLPDYDVLDDIIERYVERDQSASDIIAAGHDAETVYRIQRLIDINEYKRRQAAPGPKISHRAFGRERRYPISSGFRHIFKNG